MIRPEFRKQFEQAAPLIERALAEEGTGLHTLHDVLDYLLTDRALLWSDTRAAIVTQMYQQPQGKALLVWLAAGDLDQIVAMAENAIRPYAQREGAKVVQIIGRKGWVRALRKRGYDLHERAVIHMPIGDA